jgi:hypothetical protein
MQLTTETRLKGRARYRARDWLKVIAAARREGRVMRQIRRCFIARGRPLTTGELCDWSFGRPRRHWHYWSIYRAAPRYAVKDGRLWLPRSVPYTEGIGA